MATVRGGSDSKRLTVSPDVQWGIDPTPNVIALVEAEARAAAALREADIKFNDAQHSHLKEVSVLLAKNAETLRTSDLDRLGKTREVDVKTAEAQAAAIATAVQTLAVASDKNAEAIRMQLNADRAALAKQVTDTAATLSAGNDSAMKDVNNRIAELQKSSYQGVGKSSVADPIQAEALSEMKRIASSIYERQGKQQGLSDAAKLIVAGVTLLATLFVIGGVLVTLVLFLNRSQPPIYVPAPAGTVRPSEPPAR